MMKILPIEVDAAMNSFHCNNVSYLPACDPSFTGRMTSDTEQKMASEPRCEPNLQSTPSLLDKSEDHPNDKVQRPPSPDDSLAFEVGLSAHEYLEECFHLEVSVLNREKFNAVPEIAKSDFTVTGHLGKGSFSDVFEVMCKSDDVLEAKTSDDIPEAKTSKSVRGRETPGRRRPSRTNRSRSAITYTRSSSPSHGSRYALKCLRPQIRSDVDQFTIGAEDLVHETAILANLDHPHIIKLHGRAAGSVKNAFLLNDGYFILLDRLKETLQDRIELWKTNARHHSVRVVPVTQQMEVAHAIADAMSYLHSKRIVFRDLKPANVGFDQYGILKLYDFGFATVVPEKTESNPSGSIYDRCGTPRYMSPECGLSLGYGLPADIYGFGILLWEMCALTTPFASIKTSEEFEEEVFVQGKRPALDNRWPTTAKVIMSSCWSAVPSTRPTIDEVKSRLSLAVTKANDEKKGRIQGLASSMTRMNTMRW